MYAESYFSFKMYTNWLNMGLLVWTYVKVNISIFPDSSWGFMLVTLLVMSFYLTSMNTWYIVIKNLHKKLKDFWQRNIPLRIPMILKIYMGGVLVV